MKPLVWNERVSQQDVAPTLAALLGTSPPATAIGRPLREALTPASTPPRVVALLVLDGTRADYFDTYKDAMPTLSRMRAGGAWYSQAHVSTVPTLTAVGHANLGTGAEPQTHGLAVNYLFNRVTGKSQEAYDALDPGEMLALTLADVWNIETEGQAVIVGQGGAIRATAGLVGHGACVVNGRRVRAASYSTAGDGTFQTNEKCYTLSDALKPLTARRYWTEAGGKWLGHDIGDPTKFRHSALFQRFEGDALAAVLEAEPIGADDIPDLVLVNMKGPDYVGHAYGPASPEIKEALAELDRQIARALQIIERKAGAGRFAVAIAADHGMPGEPRPGGRHYLDDIVKRIDARFSPAGGTVVQYLQRRRQQRDSPRHGEAAIPEGLAAGRGGVPRSRGPLRRRLHRGRSAGGAAPRSLAARQARRQRWPLRRRRCSRSRPANCQEYRRPPRSSSARPARDRSGRGRPRSSRRSP